jgi:hypothetical protein
MAVIISAQITTIAIVGTIPHIPPQWPQPPPSHIIFITIAFPFAFLDPYIHRRLSPASGKPVVRLGS